VNAFDSNQYLKRRHVPVSEHAAVIEWLRSRGWWSAGQRFWATPETVKARSHERDWATGVWCDFDLARAAQCQAQRELAARAPRRIEPAMHDLCKRSRERAR
jgi:hypothetical protein